MTEYEIELSFWVSQKRCPILKKRNNRGFYCNILKKNHKTSGKEYSDKMGRLVFDW